MEGRKLKTAICILALAIPFGVFAQSTAPPPAPTLNISDDLIVVPAGQIGLALRHPGVDANSLRVTYDGRVLTPGTDYTLDSPAGVIYMRIPIVPGHSLQARYRYSEALANQADPNSNFGQMSMDLMPGSLGLNLGFGLVTRNSDGTIERSNMVGLNNKFGLGGSLLSGTVLIGSSSIQSNSDNFRTGSTNSTSSMGLNGEKQAYINESLSNKFLGGSLALNYQSISSKFNDFGGIAGLTGTQRQQLEKEKGFKQSGFSINGAKLGSLGFNGSSQTLTDGHGAITQNSLNLANKTFHFDYQSQQIGKTFSRFDDLAFSNRNDLKTEVGLNKSLLDSGLNLGKGSSLAFSQETIGDGQGSINRTDTTLSLPIFSLNFGSQKVDQEFAAMNNLLAPDKELFATEGGLRHEWFNFQTSKPKSKTSDSLNVNGLRLTSDKGSFTQFDSQFTAKNFTFTRLNSDMTSGFSSLSAFTKPEAEKNISLVNQMYGPDVKANTGAEIGAYVSGNGLSRNFTGLSYSPAKNSTLDIGSLNLKDSNGSGELDSLKFANSKYSLNYRNELVSKSFNSLSELMGFEKGQWGQVQGLNQSDLGFNVDLGKKQSFDFSSMSATSPNGEAGNYDLGLKLTPIQFNLANKRVDPTFSNVSQIYGPNAGPLGSLLGQSQTVGSLYWNLSNFFALKGDLLNTEDLSNKTVTNQQNLALRFNKNGTALGLDLNEVNNTNPNQAILSHANQAVSLSKQTGNWIFNLSQQTDNYPKAQADATLPAPVSYTSQSAGVTVKLDKTTSLSTLQTNTKLATGQSEGASTNSVTTQLSKRIGVTLSESEIDTVDPVQHSVTHSNYGFWYDLGKGLQLRYGYVNQVDSAGPTSLSSVVSLGNTTTDANAANVNSISQSNIGSWAIGGGYGANQWQNVPGVTSSNLTRTQAFSNLRLNTVKPVNFGPMKNADFHFSVDSATDNFTWIRQDNNYGGTWSMEGLSWGLNYHSQRDPNAKTAIDRAISVGTDPKKRTFIGGSIAYKMRTLPSATATTIRSYQLNINPTKRLSITNQFTTNPEVPNAAVLLGSVPQPMSKSTWNLNYAETKDSEIGGSWEEIANSQAHTSNVTAGLHATLFKTSSPLTLFYGLENAISSSTSHQLVQRWSLGYQQKMGPSQSFDFFVGDIDYQYSIPNNQLSHNLSFRLDYQLQF